MMGLTNAIKCVTLINPLRARNALRQHFRVILYTLESAS